VIRIGRFHALRRILASKRGVSTVEVALVAPFLALLIVNTIDSAVFAARKLQIQQGVNRGLEISMMGGKSTTTSTIQSETATEADVNTSDVTITQVLECDGVVVSTWSSSCTTGQETTRFITVSVTTTHSTLFNLGLLAQTLGNSNGDIPITTSGTIRIQ
jgi:Flp pilus assembly protein TadG